MGNLQLKVFSVACVLCFLLSCGKSTSKKAVLESEISSVEVDSSFYFRSNIKYAKGFKIELHEGYKEIVVLNPWNKGEVFQKYYLIPRNTKNTIDLPSDGQVIEVPIKNIAALSSTQIGVLDHLGVLDRIVAVSLSDRIFNKSLAKKVKTGEVISVGHNTTLNFEKIVDLSPELVMVAGYMKISNDEANLMKAGLPVAFNIEWMESSLLARAEWSKFIAAFFNKEDRADKLFTDIENRYLKVKAEIAHINDKPDIVSGYHYKGIWYMPGGQSYLAQLLRDAKGEYCWFADSSQGSIPLSFETVLEKQAQAKIWFGPAHCQSLKEMKDLDERYTLFQAYKDGRVYSTTKRIDSRGANDYYESGIIQPDILLKDVAKILHPDLFPDYELHFYKKLDK